MTLCGRLLRRLPCLLLLLGLGCSEPQSQLVSDRDKGETPEKIAEREARRARTAEAFDKNGVVPGERLGDHAVLDWDGEEQILSELFDDQKPTLLVTASLTCGRSRERQPWVEELAKKYRDDLNVAVVYTQEAHPTIDPSPYAKYSPELENPERPGERPVRAEHVAGI